MNNIRQAITAHFACEKSNLECTLKLEDNVNAAKAFYCAMTDQQDFTLMALYRELLSKGRYQIKSKLIERYLKNLGS